MALTTEEQKNIEQRVNKYGKSLPLAYVLYFFFGLWGVHRLYLGKIKTGLLYIAFSFFGIVLVFGNISWSFIQCATRYPNSASTMCSQISPVASLPVMAVGFVLVLLPFFWLIVDLFLIPGMVRKANSQLYERYSADLEARSHSQVSF